TAPPSTCAAGNPRHRRPSSPSRSTRAKSATDRSTSTSPADHTLQLRHEYEVVMTTLSIKDLHVSVETESGWKEILKGLSLDINSTETHAIMGPNGSGKSTLAYALAGHPRYDVTSGVVTLDGEDVLAMSVDERAKAGLFLAMQYPVEVPGVTVTNFLRTAKTAVDGEAPKLRTWTKDLSQSMKDLRMDPEFASRSVNEGFSGGEKK